MTFTYYILYPLVRALVNLLNTQPWNIIYIQYDALHEISPWMDFGIS